jgi:hypothetical protein
VAFDEVQRILHGSPVRLLDLCNRTGSSLGCAAVCRVAIRFATSTRKGLISPA